MRRLALAAAVISITAATWFAPPTSAAMNSDPPVTCTNPSPTGLCVVHVGDPGTGGNPGSGGGSTRRCVDASGAEIPCERPGLGTWSDSLGCYLQEMSPQPPPSDPTWQGHTTGAIFMCTLWPLVSTGATEIWLGTPQQASDPGAVAQQAERTLVLPQPSGHRSPSESERYDGEPFTYVNLWTWFWTDPDTWRSRSATATTGGVSATVTVSPVELLFDPGDGSAPVSCTGPGRAWTTADGNDPPSHGGCGYRYPSATDVPVTSIQSIRWSVTWQASDGTSGTLPDLTTSRSGPLMVLQIESVASR